MSEKANIADEGRPAHLQIGPQLLPLNAGPDEVSALAGTIDTLAAAGWCDRTWEPHAAPPRRRQGETVDCQSETMEQRKERPRWTHPAIVSAQEWEADPQNTLKEKAATNATAALGTLSVGGCHGRPWIRRYTFERTGRLSLEPARLCAAPALVASCVR